MQLWINKDAVPWQVSFKIQAPYTHRTKIPLKREAARAALQNCVKKIVENDDIDLEYDCLTN